MFFLVLNTHIRLTSIFTAKTDIWESFTIRVIALTNPGNQLGFYMIYARRETLWNWHSTTQAFFNLFNRKIYNSSFSQSWTPASEFYFRGSIISKHITHINRYDNHKSIKSCAKSLFNGIKTIITIWLGVIALREVAVSKIYSI